MRPVRDKPKENGPMKEHTVKLSGHAKDRFLERFFADEPALDTETRERLVRRSKTAMTSLRVRKAVLSGSRRIAPSAPPSSPPEAAKPASTEEAAPPPPTARLVPPQGTEALPDDGRTGERQVATAAPKAFDAYAVKLVPVFQRDGRDGLLSKLADIGEIDQLRQMAKAQQIVLPQPLRTGDADVNAVRSAIVEAVAKRIADRRAAAG